MRKLFAILILVLAFVFTFSVTAQAQTLNEKTDVYVGYQFLRSDFKINENPFQFNGVTDSHGFNAAVTGFVNESNVGITGELAGNFDSSSSQSLMTLMGGVTVKSRNTKVQPFMRGLVGVARQTADFTSFNRDDLGLAFAGGGGVDLRLNDKVSLRLAQIDYLQTRVLGNRVDNLRLGVGIVF